MVEDATGRSGTQKCSGSLVKTSGALWGAGGVTPGSLLSEPRGCWLRQEGAQRGRGCTEEGVGGDICTQVGSPWLGRVCLGPDDWSTLQSGIPASGSHGAHGGRGGTRGGLDRPLGAAWTLHLWPCRVARGGCHTNTGSSLSHLEARRPRGRCRQLRAPSVSPRGGSFPPGQIPGVQVSSAVAMSPRPRLWLVLAWLLLCTLSLSASLFEGREPGC